MIYTLTLNPALDYVVSANEIHNGLINRCESEYLLAGGKGINVSIMLNNLGTKSVALGFCAGYTGIILEKMLADSGVNTDLIMLENGMTRINVKIKSECETDINGNGPKIDGSDISKLYEKLSDLSEGDILVMAGSLPKSLPVTTYSNIMEFLQNKNVKIVVDATGEVLMSTLKYKPFLIKPNNFELSEIVSKDLKTFDEITEAAKKLCDMGAQNVLVSLGENGAILVSKDGVLKSAAPNGRVINTTGSGDSMVAGFLSAIENGCSYSKALSLAICAGSATAFTENIANGKQVYELLRTFENEI